MQIVPVLTVHRVTTQFAVAGHTPHIATDVVLVLQNLLSTNGFAKNRPAAKQLWTMPLAFSAVCRAVSVHATDNAVDHITTIRHCWLNISFVVDGEIIENLFAFSVHATQAVLNDNSQLIAPGRIICTNCWDSRGHQLAVTVFVLQAFAVQSCSAGSSAAQEALAASISRTPDQVANSLETEHRIVNIERHHVHAEVGIGGTSRNE